MQSIILYIKSLFSTKAKTLYLINKAEKVLSSIAKISNNEKVNIATFKIITVLEEIRANIE